MDCKPYDEDALYEFRSRLKALMMQPDPLDVMTDNRLSLFRIACHGFKYNTEPPFLQGPVKGS